MLALHYGRGMAEVADMEVAADVIVNSLSDVFRLKSPLYTVKFGGTVATAAASSYAYVFQTHR